MTEDWPPDDDAFDFDTSERRSARPDQDPYDTGEYGRRRRREGEQPPLDPDLSPPDPEGDSPREPEPEPDPFEESPPDFDSQPPSESGELPPPRYRPGEPYEDPFLETGEARRRAAERGDPFDTGEYRAHREGRPRHRDLPANVRRRQVFGVIGLVLLAFVGIYLLFFSGGGDDGGGDEGPSLKQLAGQTVVATLGEDGADQKLLEKVRKGQVGNVFIGGEPLESEVQSDVAKVQKAARQGGNPPVLVMVDQEGGFVKRLPGPPDIGPEEIADEGPETAQEEGAKTGQYLIDLGINVDLAPVIDVAHDNTEDTIVSRTFSEDPAEVGELGAAFITGLQSQRVAAAAKHFPGLGLATQNTDFGQVQIQSTTEEYQADLEPFRQAIAAGTDMIMVGTAVYPDISGDNPAAFSASVVQNELRTKLGFKGVVITDDLEAPGANESPGTAALRAIRAGCDLALMAQTDGAATSAFNSIVKAVKDGRLEESVVEDAYERVQALKQKLG